MTDAGFVLMHRSLLGHPAFRDDGEAMAFMWMIAKASWRPVRVRYKGRAVDLDRGELCVSVRDMAAAIGRDKAWVERLWKRLSRETMIETRVETAATVIKVRNYAKYQDISEGRETPDETPPETVNETGLRQRRDTEQIREQENKGNSNELPTRKRTRAEPVPKPDEVDAGVWADFERHRKAKGAPITATAIAGIKREAVKAGWSLDDALRECCNRGWQGFKAEWVDKGGNGRAGYRNGNGSHRGSNDGFGNALARAAEHFGSDYDG